MHDQRSSVFADFSPYYPRTFDALLALQHDYGHEVASTAARVIQLAASKRIREEPFTFSEETMELLHKESAILRRVREVAFIFIQEETTVNTEKSLRNEPPQS